MNSTIAKKVDTQARVIRSLNLIHCADTRHMVGAVELERLLNLEVENLELKRRIKRLEEAGDAIVDHNIGCGCGQDGPCRACRMACEAWYKAKEAKP